MTDRAKAPVRILLADDHTVVREGLRALLERNPELQVIGEAADGSSAIEAAKLHLPDIVIMDITMPNMNGMEATARLTAELPAVGVIALTMYFDKHFVAKMLRAGARGFLRKDCASDELNEAIRTVTRKKIYISPNLGFPVSKQALANGEVDSFIASTLLTTKERHVLQMVAEGRSTKEIATKLSVSPKTIDKHRQKIMDKLQIRTIAELTKFAIREGMTSLDT